MSTSKRPAVAPRTARKVKVPAASEPSEDSDTQANPGTSANGRNRSPPANRASNKKPARKGANRRMCRSRRFESCRPMAHTASNTTASAVNTHHEPAGVNATSTTKATTAASIRRSRPSDALHRNEQAAEHQAGDDHPAQAGDGEAQRLVTQAGCCVLGEGRAERRAACRSRGLHRRRPVRTRQDRRTRTG